jgi:hypothetical protein
VLRDYFKDAQKSRKVNEQLTAPAARRAATLMRAWLAANPLRFF